MKPNERQKYEKKNKVQKQILKVIIHGRRWRWVFFSTISIDECVCW